ncbi:UxaA family hydrolase [Pectinatus cerevisiiphilus]|uniref:Altronate hydrolase n=1 Tax=Pectinatus cerevisiiphilus TaxID=86956 RepID=A0A4R3K5P1_9FIRM|nr:altronate dehydratase family protein [Pectinatus cerevisiiphilus]TCS77991.1 altronate hydrolase [Pectinatus cerevisiiphilus]
MRALQINKADNAAVALENLLEGDCIEINGQKIILRDDIHFGHKFALRNIIKGENIIKYGFPIGHASSDIPAGAHIHTHNVKTNLGELLTYKYTPVKQATLPKKQGSFKGYKRGDGTVGIRNHIFIVPTVNCVTSTIRFLEKKGRELCQNYANVDDCIAVSHPYGCSQIGDDYRMTQRILADIVKHPNAGAVLVVGLGCENNNVDEFKKVLGEFDERRVKFLITQEVPDENAAGEKLLKELAEFANGYERTECPLTALRIGLKCGGSDGLSGITANPLIGALSDLMVGSGATTILTEVPEMFGAETLLMNRAVDKNVFNNIVDLINNFKKYFKRYGQVISDNPSPGNKKGGITTLEDKSLGCVQKGGTAAITNVLDYADTIKGSGLQLLNAPGNDSVSTTALAAAGCQLILFSTGRGTPWGTIVPVLKIATNPTLAEYKANWIDFNAGKLLQGLSLTELRDKLFTQILQTASGELTKSEKMDFHEIAIMKDGVTE